MEPLTRVVFSFPVYALDLLSGDVVVVAGGGGRMKSGIPNSCQVLNFDEKNATLTPTATAELSDAAVALTTHESVIHLVIGPGVKDYSFLRGKLVPVSSFYHDLQVSTTEEQTAIAASEDASTLVVASDEGNVVVLHLECFEPVFSGRIHTNGITDLCVLFDGSLVATTGRDKAAHIWRSRDGEILQTLKPVMASSYRTHIRAIRFCSAHSDLLFSAESNPRKGGWIAAWRKPSASETTLYAPLATIRASNDALTAMCVNADGSLLACSSAEGHVSLFAWNGTMLSKKWSTETRTHLFKTPKPPHVLPVTAMRFSMSGRHVFAASADYTLSVWPTRVRTRLSTCSRLLIWLLSMLVLAFAMLVAEDEHLPTEIGRRRAVIAPYMEPHLSEVQRVVRPLLRESYHAMQPQLVSFRQRTSGYISSLSKQGYPILEIFERVSQSLGIDSSDDQSVHESFTPEPTVDKFLDSSADAVRKAAKCKRRREGKRVILDAHKAFEPEPTVDRFLDSNADAVRKAADCKREREGKRIVFDAYQAFKPEPTVDRFLDSNADAVRKATDCKRELEGKRIVFGAYQAFEPEPTVDRFLDSNADAVRKATDCKRELEGKRIVFGAYQAFEPEPAVDNRQVSRFQYGRCAQSSGRGCCAQSSGLQA
eukprot:TRINITY_DN24_c0_g1_i7.p1 TRINITY_DN24_c0_g1~~TRINITY_DN24_c0_g1_i7.p1  ORF type:complete len:652 (-),score=78.29 TRINITY_DN24_c0_g1_i7:2428-4383(-)